MYRRMILTKEFNTPNWSLNRQYSSLLLLLACSLIIILHYFLYTIINDSLDSVENVFFFCSNKKMVIKYNFPFYRGKSMKYISCQRKNGAEIVLSIYLPPMSKGLLVPVGLNMLYRWYITETAGFKSKFVPATIAASHCPVWIAVMASCKQNKALEHAVSTTTLGPVEKKNIITILNNYDSSIQ